MSKFLTPPVWYDKNGEENQSLVNYANAGVSGPTNIAFGLDAKSGTDNDSHSCIAVGYQATATGQGAIAVGSYDSNGNPATPSTGASAIGPGTIAIGGGASATDGSLAIGDSASANVPDSIAIGGSATAGSHQIQLGGNNNLFNLTVGDGTGALGIGSIKFEKMTKSSETTVPISSPGVYLCCATNKGLSEMAIIFIENTHTDSVALQTSDTLCKYVAQYQGEWIQQIQVGSGATINYCFKIIDVTA